MFRKEKSLYCINTILLRKKRRKTMDLLKNKIWSAQKLKARSQKTNGSKKVPHSIAIMIPRGSIHPRHQTIWEIISHLSVMFKKCHLWITNRNKYQRRSQKHLLMFKWTENPKKNKLCLHRANKKRKTKCRKLKNRQKRMKRRVIHYCKKRQV